MDSSKSINSNSSDFSTSIGDFKLEKEIGEGAFSKVMLATNEISSKECAIKFIKADENISEKNLKSFFKNEVKVLKKCDHPNICKILGYSYRDSVPGKENYCVSYIALEYMKNGTLFDILENGALEAKYTRVLFKQVLSAIEYLHKLGYSHRDIKLDNILVSSNYDLKLADFGLASKSKKSSTVKGTLYYMAPEVVAEKEYNTNDSDLYAIAIVLFSMLTHSMPFNVASKKCPLYRKIMTDDWASFWKTHSSSKLIDNDFKDLFAKMVDPNLELRLSISEILDHPWMKGETATKEEVVKHLKTRIQSEVNLTKTQNKEESTNMAERTGYFNIRSAGKLMKYLEEFAKNEKLNYKTCPNYYRMIAEIGKKPKDLVLQMNILKRHESYQRCVELILINGKKKDFLNFKSKVEEFIASRQNN